MDRLRALVGEIHRRSLWQVLGVYLAGSWVALEVVGGIVDSAGLPDWLPGLALALLVIGLPVVLATAVVQEGTPRGSGAAGDGEAGRSPSDPEGNDAGPEIAGAHSGRTGLSSVLTWPNAAMGGVGALALWGVVATGLLFSGQEIPAVVGDGPGRAVIAVLPFTNMGGEENEAFTAGLHDEILTQLAGVSSLDVISRTSVLEYRDTRTNVREIAEELGAGVVLEGSVQRVGGELRFIAQLIDARTDRHLWADSFDEALTTDRVFQVQSDLARRVADALRATLSPEEAAELSNAPTESPEAYELLLRGNAYFALGPRADSFPRSIGLYRAATEVDPDFALAHARIARAHGAMYQTVEAGDTTHLRLAREAAGRALDLDPDLGEARLALGELHYWAERDYARALSELSRARDAGLGSADLHHALGAVQRRMDDWDASIESFREASRLDPRSAHFLEDVCDTHRRVGRLAGARAACERAAALEPDEPRHAETVAWIDVLSGEAPAAVAAALRGRTASGEAVGSLAYLAWLDRDFETVLDLREYGLLRADALDRIGRADEARGIRERALARWEAPEEGDPFTGFSHMEHARLLAGLGRAEEALTAVDRALAAIPFSRDALAHRQLLWGAVLNRAAAGDPDGALDALARLRELRSEHTPALLRLEPALDPLRVDPRFRDLAGG